MENLLWKSCKELRLRVPWNLVGASLRKLVIDLVVLTALWQYGGHMAVEVIAELAAINSITIIGLVGWVAWFVALWCHTYHFCRNFADAWRRLQHELKDLGTHLYMRDQPPYPTQDDEAELSSQPAEILVHPPSCANDNT